MHLKIGLYCLPSLLRWTQLVIKFGILLHATAGTQGQMPTRKFASPISKRPEEYDEQLLA